MRAANGTTTTYQGDVSAALGSAGGALGASAVYFGGAFRFPNVTFPNGVYALINPPVAPVSLCVNVSFPLQIGVGVACTNTICFKATLSPTLGAVAFGAGTVTYTTGVGLLTRGVHPS
jgi:hypothetical protein